MIKQFFLRDQNVKRLALAYVANLPTDQDHPLVVKVQEMTRSLEQNAKFHAICEDIANSGYQWAGKARTAAQWKVLLVSGHSIATGQGADILPGIENEFLNLRESTARMSKARSSSLIEYTLAFCADRGIEVSDRMAE